MEKVLIIDDEQAFRQACRWALQRSGFEVVEASDGNQGLKVLNAEPVDVVPSDVLMPNTDGIELLQAIRRRHPGTPVVMMSGGGSLPADDCLSMARQLGAAGGLRKPFEFAELVRVIREAVAAPVH